MIWLDWPLFGTILLFFVLSWFYGWGLVQFFGHNFRWSLAAVVGIASVISLTYVLVWQVRGLGSDTLQPVWDLALVFLAALPGMTWVDYKLKTYRENGQKTRIRELLKEQKEAKMMLREILMVLNLRREAQEYLERVSKN